MEEKTPWEMIVDSHPRIKAYEEALERILALDSRDNLEPGQFCDAAVLAIGIAWEALRDEQ